MAAAEISAKQVMDLRAATGLPMMKCKEALEAAKGDFSQAVDHLRKQGLATAAKKADRAMKSGRIAIRQGSDGSTAAMVEVACETDPVTENADFRSFVDRTCEAVLTLAKSAPTTGPLEVPSEKALSLPLSGGETVDSALKMLVARITENMAVRRAAAARTTGRIGSYLHFNGRFGVLVEVTGPKEALEAAPTTELLSGLGKHITFRKPLAVTRTEVSPAVVAKELEIYREQVKQDPKMAGKPPQVLERIVQGKLESFYSERCLLDQAWVLDEAQSVKQVLETTGKAAGGALSITRFALFQVGA